MPITCLLLFNITFLFTVKLILLTYSYWNINVASSVRCWLILLAGCCSWLSHLSVVKSILLPYSAWFANIVNLVCHWLVLLNCLVIISYFYHLASDISLLLTLHVGNYSLLVWYCLMLLPYYVASNNWFFLPWISPDIVLILRQM